MMTGTSLRSALLRLEHEGHYVSRQLASLAGNESVKAPPAAGLRINAWDEMWITSFFPDTKMYHFAFFNCYPIVRVNNVWMLERLDDATPDYRVTRAEGVSDRYRLIQRGLLAKQRSKCSTSLRKPTNPNRFVGR